MGLLGFGSKKVKIQLSREESLKSRPIRNKLLQWEKDLVNEVMIFIPRKETRWVKFLTKFVYIPKRQRILLDKLGSEVWSMCDGKNTVEDMIQKFSARHKLNRKEAETSMITYLKQMAEKGLIGFAVPKKKEVKNGVKKSGHRQRIRSSEDSKANKAALSESPHH